MTPALPPSPGWTQVVQVTGGRTVYLSGQIALDPAGQIVGRRRDDARVSGPLSVTASRRVRAFS